MDTLIVTGASQDWAAAQQLVHDHNLSLVVLSGLVAIFSAFTAAQLVVRLRTASGDRQRAIWLIAAATCLGGGAWSAHFIGMLSMSMLPAARYDILLILVAVAASVAASAGACRLLVSELREPVRVLFAGSLFGAGNIAAHYFGMAALNPQFMVRFPAEPFLLSTIVMLILSVLAARLLLPASARDDSPLPLRLFFGATFVGLSLTLMHFLATSRAYLLPVSSHAESGLNLDVDLTATAIAVVTLLVNAAALIGALMEHRVRVTSDSASQRLQLILDSLPIGIAYLDTQLRFRFVNRTFLDMYRLGDDDVIGRSLEDTAPADAFAHVLPHYRSALNGQRVDFTTTTPLTDGQPSVRNVLLLPEHHADGDVRGIFVAAHDVSEQYQAQSLLKESEHRLQALLEHVPAAVFLKDQNARYVMINRQFQDWFGVDNDTVIGKTVLELYPPERAKRYWKGDLEILASPEVISDEVDIPTADGDVRTFTLTKYPIVSDSEVRGYGGIIVDITERALAERTARRSERRAELANRAKSEFLANMSHELRTPLNAILGFTEILRGEMLGPMGTDRYVEYAGDIHSSAEHLLGLINDILDLSKIESGNDVLLEEDFHLSDVIGSVMTLVKGRALDGQVTIKADIPEGLPALCADKRKLKQILVNLLTNALKFTPAGGLVTVRAHCCTERGFELQVQDTGIGMALEDIPRALSPFGQLDSALSRRFEGTGLGLPLTKQLVELHGGSLDLHSVVGTGTTAIVNFPAERIVPDSTVSQRRFQAGAGF